MHTLGTVKDEYVKLIAEIENSKNYIETLNQISKKVDKINESTTS